MICFCTKAQKQTYVIDYDFKTSFKTLPNSFIYTSSLYLQEGSKQIYQIKYSQGVIKEEKKSNMISPEISIDLDGADKFFYKPVDGDTLIYEANVIFKEYIVEDYPEFQWDLTDETKTILGFLCYKAITSFRGREYIIYYTREASVSGAPWKFNGLPGLVLEVHSIDEEFQISATSFRIVEDTFIITNPFNTKAKISWEDYKALYTIEYEKALATEKGDPLNFESMPKMQFELLVD